MNSRALEGVYGDSENESQTIIAVWDALGEPSLAFLQVHTGRFGILQATADDTFTTGPGLMIQGPVEITFHFFHNGDQIRSLSLRQTNHKEQLLQKLAIHSEEISFRNGDVTLAGTLLLPAAARAVPGLVALHASGDATRYGFGPFPYFFASRGLAVLIYDKRGNGSSTGNKSHRDYDQLASDGDAAVKYLQSRKQVRANKVGVWGPSQGGMLCAAVAALDSSVAFLINQQGYNVPTDAQEFYNREAEMRANGVPEEEIHRAVQFEKDELEAAKTGRKWEEILKEASELKKYSWYEQLLTFDSKEEAIWFAKHIYSYDPSLNYRRVFCPVLAIFGDLDVSTPSRQSHENMIRELQKARNHNITFLTYSHAIHGMLESNTSSKAEIPRLRRFVPGFLPALSRWIGRNTDAQPL